MRPCLPNITVALLLTIAAAPVGFAAPTRAGPREVTVMVTLAGGDHEAPTSVRARALEEARRRAVRTLAGPRVHTSLWMRQSEVAATQGRPTRAQLTTHAVRLLQETSAAVLLDEAILEDRVTVNEAGRGFVVHVRLRVRGVPRVAPPPCTLRAQLSRSRVPEGEEVRLRVSADRDVSLYVVSIAGRGHWHLVSPVGDEPPAQVHAGHPTWLPTDAQRAAGATLVGALPAGLPESVETLRIIGLLQTRPKSPLQLGGLPQDNLSSLLGAVAALGEDAFCETQLSYVVHQP